MQQHTLATPLGGQAASSPREWQTLALMAFGFALVNLDRFIMYPLFPVMARELGLDYQDIGLISAAVALTWGISSMVFGRLSDRLGRRGILVTAVLVFSVLCGATGLAMGLGSLLLIRAFMGIFEGAFVPVSIATVVETSPVKRVGRNTGIHQLMAPLVGSAVAPVLAIYLLQELPSWRWVFAVTALPGLLCAWLIFRNLADAEHIKPGRSEVGKVQMPIRKVLAYPNVALCSAGFSFWLAPVVVFGALMPSYLTDFLHLELKHMGLVMSMMGVGGAAGMLVLPTLSDRWGRKKLMVACLTLAMVPTWLFMQTGADPLRLSLLMFVATFFFSGGIAMVHSVTADNVPAQHISTATGFIVGIGEIVGGAMAPALAGGLAKALGITVILPFTLCCLVLGLIFAVLLRSPLKDLK
ncbi:MAG TPA: MFS transporter [Rhodoferax sp.]|uniref:MFS transporter n=1 Tax=Rhodoferax sp. TaxID=50421 RepID=UPI000ED3E865|nr:MFS transporter [Rhodoferax sp.]HCX82943.1 MFS transporter [Rhodoferax sp.]